MGRGRRRISLSNHRCDSQLSSALISQGPSPLKPKYRRKFNGKLSHRSPVPGNKIRKYFDPKQTSFETKPKISYSSSALSIVTTSQNSHSVDDGKCKVLQETNRLENNGNKFYSTSQPENIKTEICVPLSPSIKLSQLHLSSPPKIKICKRLILINENPVQNVNISPGKISIHSSNAQTKLTEFFPVRRSIRKTGKTVLEERKKTIEEAVLLEKEEGLEIRIFEGKGRGIIAAKNFKKGEFVVEYAGEFITIEEAHRREAIYAGNENIGCYMYYFKHRSNQYCIDATVETDRLGRLLNHCRNGNLSPKTIEVRGVPRLILLAKEDIKQGTELTYDYGDRSKVSLQYHPWLAQ